MDADLRQRLAEVDAPPGNTAAKVAIDKTDRAIRKLDFDDPDYMTRHTALLRERALLLQAVPAVLTTAEKLTARWAILNEQYRRDLARQGRRHRPARPVRGRGSRTTTKV